MPRCPGLFLCSAAYNDVMNTPEQIFEHYLSLRLDSFSLDAEIYVRQLALEKKITFEEMRAWLQGIEDAKKPQP